MLRLAVLMIAFASLLGAQEFRGAILGRVTDSSGAVVVGAGIQVTNADTNVTVSTAANQEGNYQVPFLLPGNYVVKVQYAGFKNVERPGVRVSVNAPVTVDFALEVGAAAETVTVTASAPLLNATGADLGQVVQKAYVDFNSGGSERNVMNLMNLAPGVTGAGGTFYTDNAQKNISITGGGSTQGGNEFLVDGIPNTVPQSGGLVVFVPSLDSVEEFKVHTTLFDAAYGHSNGGAISITTRGGTNELHGVVSVFKDLPSLSANSWTNNRLGLPRVTSSSRRMWGYTVGGPVWLPRLYNGRNRTFFSTSLERDERRSQATRQGRVPTELERAGDFSQTLNQLGSGLLGIYDPATTTITGSAASRQPFAGARIPAARLSPIGAAVMRVFPLPSLSGASQIGRYNWALSGYYPVSQKQFSVRIDHSLGSKHRLYGRVGRLERDQNVAAENLTFPGFYGAPVFGNNDHNKRYFTSIALDDTIVFSPSFVGSLRYGLSRRLETVTNGTGGGLDPANLRLPDIVVGNQALKGYPVFSLGENMVSIGSGSSGSASDLHAVLATFTKLAGRHSLKFGMDYRLNRWNQLTVGAAAPGQFSFGAVFTQADPYTARSADTSGTAMASLLLGTASGGSLGYTSPFSVQSHYLSGFVQEDWKVRPRLTLNFGLRYELETPYTERYNRASYGFDRDARLPVQVPGLDLRGGILFAGVGGNPRRVGRVDANNFGPRFGFAYNLIPKTVLRGGYGLFFSGQGSNTSGFPAQSSVFNAVTPYVGTLDNGATAFTTLSNPFPNGLQQPLGTAPGLMAQAGDSLTFFEQGRVSPYNQQWQFSIQRELPSQVLVEAAYVAMLSLKQFESFNLNEKPDRYLALGAAENTRVPNPFLGVFPPTSSLGQGATITQRSLWPAFPQFTSLTMQGANTGRAIYHALQLKVEKRFTHGLNLLWNYTNSKLIDNNTTSIVNQRHYRSVSALDQGQIMRLAMVYQLPLRFAGPGWNRLWTQALGGWSVSGALDIDSGTPLSISQANGRPLRLRNAAKSGSIEERLGDRRDSAGRVLNPYFDTTAFAALPNQYTISPEPPYLDELRAPGMRRLNASLFKTFPLRERVRLEVRLEGNGVTNTPWFSAPGTNMSNLSTFGVITSSSWGNRSFQGGARLVF